MALATFSRGTKAKLDATEKTDGRIYVTTDTGNMYVDVGNETDSSAQRFLIGADGIKAASDAVASAKSYTDTVAAGKANTAHTHEMADVTGLSDALAGKADATHTHAIADVDGLQAALTKLNSAPPAVKVASVSYAVTSNNYHFTATAPTVSGYTFVCWVDFRPTNGYGVWKAANYTAAATDVWPQVPESVTTYPSDKRIYCYALYTRNS